jgi:hypothetical protein
MFMLCDASDSPDTEGIYEVFLGCFDFGKKDLQIETDSTPHVAPSLDQGSDIKWLKAHWSDADVSTLTTA